VFALSIFSSGVVSIFFSWAVSIISSWAVSIISSLASLVGVSEGVAAVTGFFLLNLFGI